MKRALISVADKTNLEKIGTELSGEYELISTGSTAVELEKLGFEVTKISDILNFKEIIDGRVKTLHPVIHGGILSRRTSKDNHELNENNIIDIDIVICNLYPFEHITKLENIEFQEAIENIDIGGVTLLRAAAKNHEHVSVITNPSDYNLLENEIPLDIRRKLAVKSFEHTAYYDMLIMNYLKSEITYEDNEIFITGGRKVSDLRYGENNHQKATYYQTEIAKDYSLSSCKQLGGKELSYNNIKDIDVALNLISEFDSPSVVALKHNVPCGVGINSCLDSAFSDCLEMDSISIFGGIVVLNDIVDGKLAEKLNKIFLEVVIAPKFDELGLEILKQKPNLRILEVPMNKKELRREVLSINGGILVQDKDQNDIMSEQSQIVSMCVPDKMIIKQAKVCQIVAKYVKSNSIVIGTKDKIISQAGGQTSRIDAAIIALQKAKKLGYEKNLIMASDAFFPFSDVVELAKEYGVKTIIQPGGSIRDVEVIQKANELGLEMIFTGVRHFKH